MKLHLAPRSAHTPTGGAWYGVHPALWLLIVIAIVALLLAVALFATPAASWVIWADA